MPDEHKITVLVPVIHFLRRLADSDGTLQRYQINPDTDAQTIVDAEHAGFLVRHFKQMARRGDQRFLRATITPQGRDLLTEMDALERVIREDKAVLRELADAHTEKRKSP